MLNELNATRASVAYHRNNAYSVSLNQEFQKQLPSKEFVAECGFLRETLALATEAGSVEF